MTQFYSPEIESQMLELYARLPEKNKRLYAGVEALKLPYGGISYIAKLFNCSRETIYLGINELNEENSLPPNRNRHRGGGRKSVVEKQPRMTETFLFLIKEHTAGEGAAFQ